MNSTHDSQPDNTDAQLPPDLYPIRLQGPWEIAAADAVGVLLSHRRIKLPCRLPAEWSAATSRIELRRRFHRPTNLDPEEAVVILLPAGCRPLCIALNNLPCDDQRLLDERVTARVTDLLQPSNELRIEVSPDDAPSLGAFAAPVLLGVMPDVDGTWWDELPRCEG
ncbi:MAG: hypothetical protein R3B90_08820 [Planctomycetaceae bacterium]